jgi:hypothetical protein
MFAFDAASMRNIPFFIKEQKMERCCFYNYPNKAQHLHTIAF